MYIAAAVLALVAAAIHVYIFVLEAFWWTTPRGRAVFGTTVDEAEQTRALALNQGFYNLFLAVAAGLGAVLVIVEQHAVGATLIYAGCGSMLAAGLVLLVTDRTKAQPATIQAAPPLAALICLSVALL